MLLLTAVLSGNVLDGRVGARSGLLPPRGETQPRHEQERRDRSPEVPGGHQQGRQPDTAAAARTGPDRAMMDQASRLTKLACSGYRKHQ